MFKKPKNVKRRRLLIIVVTLIILIIGFTYWFIPPVWKLSGDNVTINLCRENEEAKQCIVGPQKKGWTHLKKISQHLLDSVIVAEDARFYQHHGIDFIEIKKSIDTNFKEGRIARGASTITQQVVKMAFLTRDKSFVRKAREAIGALLLETLLEKNQILEWYVNLAEFGDGIYGITAAADQYFQIKPKQITTQQAIHLALILPNPKVWSTGLRRKDLTDFGHERFSQIADHLRQSGYITEAQWINVLATGNFGSPIKDYERIITQYFQDNDSSTDIEDVNFFQDGLPQQESSESDH